MIYRGRYCRYGPSINTRRLVLEHGGFLYDSDSYADDLPYACSDETKRKQNGSIAVRQKKRLMI